MKKAIVGVVVGFLFAAFATNAGAVGREAIPVATCAPDCVPDRVRRNVVPDRVRRNVPEIRVRRNVPEIDAKAGGVAIALLAGVVLLVAERGRRV